MSKVDVSIIIPVYNVQEYLSGCIDSVVNQTIKNKEIIIVNDGSTDKCYEILKEYKEKYPEIIIINQENRGISETRNAGLRVASGEYIAFVDSDDFIDLNMFEKMYMAAKSKNADTVICNYILYTETPDNPKINDHRIEGLNKEGYIGKVEALKKFLLNDIKGYVWNKLHKRDLFTENNITFPDFIVCEDTPVEFLLIAGSKKIYLLNEPLYYYRQRESSLTRTFSIKSMKDMIDGCYIMRDYIAKNPLLYVELNDYYKVYMIKTLWAIHNKYWIQYCETKEKDSYTDFEKIVLSDIDILKISEIICNNKLTVKQKINTFLIKTRTYGIIFPILYKLKSIKS